MSHTQHTQHTHAALLRHTNARELPCGRAASHPSVSAHAMVQGGGLKGVRASKSTGYVCGWAPSRI